MFKFKITPDSHNGRQNLNYCVLPQPVHFFLPSTFKENLKANIYIYVNSTTQRCPNKIIKIFLIEDFFHLPPVSTTPLVHLELQISPQIFEKICNGCNGILRC